MFYDRHLAASVSNGKLRSGAATWTARSGIARPQFDAALIRAAFSVAAALCDIGAIIASAVVAGTIYHATFYDPNGMLENFVVLGVGISALFVGPNAARHEYAIPRFLTWDRQIPRAFVMWNMSFVIALLLAFMSKTSADVSRGTFIAFYFVGLLAVCSVRVVLHRTVQTRLAAGGVGARRVFLVGFEEDIERFSLRHQPWTLGMRIVSSAVLRGEESLKEDLALAAASARMLRPEDVFILAPWSDKETIDACVNAFLRVPATIHLGPERVLERFTDAHLERTGNMASLALVRRPLSAFEVIQKRALDVTLAAIALVLLSPFFLLVALAIKLDSRGPVLFTQRRYGFNQEPFRIYKFRSMSTMDDGRVVRQATANDSRITRIGRFLRRCNIDELPQLINVLRGEMSLVGPRPHAMAHDQQYEGTIALYARRHNVKPGITGWAQVNGFRGETSTNEKMQKRVEFDLHYIDNWSLLLDLKIMVLTVLSSKAYRNAL